METLNSIFLHGLLSLIKPIHSLVSYVMDGVGKPSIIVDGSNSPHNFNLKPNNAKAIENADIIFWVGEDIESFLEKPLGQGSDANDFLRCGAAESDRNGRT